eukprot:gene8511-335_t
MSLIMKKVLCCIFFLLVLVATINGAPVQCAAKTSLSFDVEDFFNLDNTNVKYYYPQDEETATLGTKVLFFRRIGRALRKVGRAVSRVARGVARVAKKVAKTVVKVVKAIGKAFTSLIDAVRGAKKKAKRVSDVFARYVGPYQKGGCASRYVCEYDCSSLINCPVNPNQASDFKGFMDLTNEVKRSSDQMQSYKWVCKNTLFSGNNQRVSFISKIWRKIAYGVTDVDDKEFEARNPQYSTTAYDDQFLKYLAGKKVDGNDLEILSILNDYKDGLHGFSKICRLNPQWMSQLTSTLREFEQESMKKSYEKPSGAEADSTVEAFRKMRNYLSNLSRKQAYDPTTRYKYDLMNSLLNKFRSEFIDQLKGNKVQQEYCACGDYGRFFYYMNKVSSTTRKNYYGVNSVSFDQPYITNLKNGCVSRCVNAMKARGYSKSKIDSAVQKIVITVSLTPGDQNDNRDIQITTGKKGNNYQVTNGSKKVGNTARKVINISF